MSLEHYMIHYVLEHVKILENKPQAFKNDLEMLKIAHAWIIFYSSYSSPEAKFLVRDFEVCQET
jgi:hypothetical protein